MISLMKTREILLSLLSGLLLVFSFPNFDLEFLAWVALVPLFYSMEGKGLFHAFTLGFLTGFISYIGILYWIIVAVHTYGNIPLILSGLILLLLVTYLSIFTGAFAFFTRLIQLRSGFQTILFTPLLWVTLEYVRSFLLTGFPWANLAIPNISTSLSSRWRISLEPMASPSSSFWSMPLSFGCFANGQKRHSPCERLPSPLLILLGFLIYGYVKMRAIDQQILSEPSLKIGLVQGNIDQSIKWDESFQKETLRIYERLSLRVAEEKPDLIIWPETATPFFFQEAQEYQPMVLDIPKRTNAFLLFGTPSYKIERGKVNYYNSAYLVSPLKEIVGKYDKIHLVPYGEYVPLGEILPLGSLGEGIGNFKSGKVIFNFSLPQGQFGVLICFEIIFPDLCRRFVKKGANFLVTITNDAWFKRTSAPYQHFSMATFRAVENRVFIARAANTGISGFIDPKGKIVKQGEIFTEEAMNGTIRLSKKKTFYTLYGDVFAWICSAFSLLLLGYAFVQKRSKK